MTCNFDRLIDYLNDSLSENQDNDIFLHLQNCDICLEAVTLIMQDRFFKDPGPALVEKKIGPAVAAC